MKRIIAITVLSFVAFVAGFASISDAHADPTGNTFRVTVKTSFGTTFTDCYRFDVPVAGSLTIDLLSQVLTYRHGQLDEADARSRFKAVSRFGQPLSIMFYGEEIEALEQLTGEAVSEFGDTFVFSGPETGPSTSPQLCVPGVGAPGVTSSTAASPYEP
jgi:hypothetical protein